MARKKLSKRELKEKLYRRRFLVPNAVTLGNMFCGFLSCIYGASGRFEKGAIAIGLAILLDGLDGRVARRLNATSKFGLEFDSFSDLISFGLAPAMLMYHWCFQIPADEFGVLVSFVYAICAASRLARFNISPPNLKAFMGLPSPGAAGMVAAVVYAESSLFPSNTMCIEGAIALLALGYLMVSRIEFFSIKSLKVSRLGFGFIVVGALIALIWWSQRIGLLVLSGGYALSGPLQSILRKRKRQPQPATLSGSTPATELRPRNEPLN